MHIVMSQKADEKYYRKVSFISSKVCVLETRKLYDLFIIFVQMRSQSLWTLNAHQNIM